MEDQPRTPRGGDAVRLTAPWQWGALPAGELGLIDGGSPGVGHVRILFKASMFRERSTGAVSCSGGPGTIATPIVDLKPTDEQLVTDAWDWDERGPGQDHGVWYQVTVPIWEWEPDDHRGRFGRVVYF
jgi:hypothetical protein